jgi:hypothetical protein
LQKLTIEEKWIKKRQIPQRSNIQGPTANSLLDKMVDGREFESILKFKVVNLEIAPEIRKSLKEVWQITF